MAPPQDPNVIAPDGDVTLTCGEQLGDGVPVMLQVNSTIMSYASEVFKALLSPRFKEGSALAANASAEVALPEDNGRILRHICMIFHHRLDALPITMSVADLIVFAQLCDKYHCTTAVRMHVGPWIGRQMDHAMHDDRLLLREAAILLRHDRMVKKVSSQLVYNSTANCHLPSDLADFAAGIRRRIVVYIERQIDLQLAHPECTALPRCISLMLSRMKHVDLFPITNNSKSVAQLCAIMTSTTYTDPTENVPNHGQGCKKHNLHSLRNLQGEFIKEATAIRTLILNMDLKTRAVD
ncbi:hypothetical protein LTR86_002400 [Recurvomyces mirabilis]|nr:hypothetical protein LTR86_002400 [Recurvomyces mirabilis]